MLILRLGKYVVISVGGRLGIKKVLDSVRSGILNRRFDDTESEVASFAFKAADGTS